jgi:FkbM family methyltransferase
MDVSQATRLLKNLDRLPELAGAYRQAGDWLSLSLRYLDIVPHSFPFDVRLRDGVRFRFECAEEIKVFWNIFFRSTYHIDPCDRLILDAGANIGLYAVWAARRAPGARIVSLEPWPSTFDRLARHIEMNRLADRIVAAPLALAGECGWREMLGSDKDSCKNRLQLDRERPASDRRPQDVALTAGRTLEAVMDQFKIGALDLLKLDIEGSEYETLLSTPLPVLRRIGKINLEYHEVPAHLGYSKRQLFAYLAEAGHAPISVIEDRYRTGVALFKRSGR